MKQIELDPLVRATRRLRRVAFLVRRLRHSGLGRTGSIIVLVACAILLVAAPFVGLSILFTPDRRLDAGLGILALLVFQCASQYTTPPLLKLILSGGDGIVEACTILFVMILLAGAIFVSPILLLAAGGTRTLRRQIAAHGLGTDVDWLEHFTEKPSQIPVVFPTNGTRRFWAITTSVLVKVLRTGVIILLALSQFVPGGLAAAGIALALYFPVWRSFRRNTAVPSAAILQEDKRSPILLLRAFSDDAIRIKDGFFSLQIGRPFRFEERVAMECWREGPVVAIGKPGELLPEFGACREYHPDDKWQSRVSELIVQAKGVFMIAGLTQALQWEIQEAREQQAIEKILFLTPPLERGEVVARLRAISGHVPEYAGLAWLDDKQLGRVIAFARGSGGSLVVFTSRGRTGLDYSVAIHAAFVWRIGQGPRAQGLSQDVPFGSS